MCGSLYVWFLRDVKTVELWMMVGRSFDGVGLAFLISNCLRTDAQSIHSTDRFAMVELRTKMLVNF